MAEIKSQIIPPPMAAAGLLGPELVFLNLEPEQECGWKWTGSVNSFQIRTLCRCKRIPTDAVVCPWNNQIYACCPDRLVSNKSDVVCRMRVLQPEPHFALQ